MDVVVLPPQDCLKRHHHHHNQRRLISPNKPRRNPNANPTNPTNQATRSSRRRRSSNSPPPRGPARAHPQPAGPPLSGPIRILKRGEDLALPVKPKPEVARPTGPIGPMFINGFYAGSACVTSPAPSELPVPAFFSRSCGLSVVAEDNNQKIASDLRRVLKLF